MTSVQRIDTHVHVNSCDDVRYPPVQDPVRPPGTSGTLASFKRHAEENGITRMCVVQPSSFYGWDSRFICDLALAEPDTIAAICTPNPEDATSPASVARLKKHYGIRGIRSLPAADGRIDHPGVRKLWRACAENDITINVFIKRDRAQELIRLLNEFSDVRCVIDHCLLLATEPDVDATLKALFNLAQFPNAFAKVTSMYFDERDSYPYRSLHEPLRRIIASYSPNRCVWGSSFPCELWTPRSTYRQNLELFSRELGLSPETQEAIFWNTPSRLWFEER